MSFGWQGSIPVEFCQNLQDCCKLIEYELQRGRLCVMVNNNLIHRTMNCKMIFLAPECVRLLLYKESEIGDGCNGQKVSVMTSG